MAFDRTKTYWKKLRDPRWQKKAAGLKEKADWKCEDCHSAQKTLHVHHTHYFKGVEPWDTPDKFLRVLCEDCHALAEKQRSNAHMMMADYFSPLHQVHIASLLCLIRERGVNPSAIVGALEYLRTDPEMIRGLNRLNDVEREKEALNVD